MDNLERSELLGHDVSKERKFFNSNALMELVRIKTFDQSDVSQKENWET